MTMIKICGLRSLDDVRAANALGPDMVGFVLHRPSRRFVTREALEVLSPAVDPSVTKVGVFVDEDPLVIADLVGSGLINAVQLHGVEDRAYIHGLRTLVRAPIIKTFIVKDASDIDSANSSDADMVLLDAGMGSGRTFDWSFLEGMGRDYILSGGLDPANVSDAVARLRPFGVDVSSGVETDGRKDQEKMSGFVESARTALQGFRASASEACPVSFVKKS